LQREARGANQGPRTADFREALDQLLYFQARFARRRPLSGRSSRVTLQGMKKGRHGSA
jgi:hypothetical protein